MLTRLMTTKNKIVDPGIRICIVCGSTLTVIDEETLICKECGETRYFENDLVKTLKMEKKSKIT